jgi:hypothetical protein
VQQNLRSGAWVVTGENWPIFIYEDYKYDANDPVKGFLRSEIMLAVITFSSLSFSANSQSNS